MADTSFDSSLQVQQWQQSFYTEYVRGSRFGRYTGSDNNKVIQLVMDLSRKRGDTITVQLVTRLTGAGITGDNTLKGNEESLGNYGDAIVVDQLRNAVRRGEMEQQKGNIDILNAARVQLKKWAMEQLRDDIIARMLSPNLDGLTTYASSSETDKDTWLDSNTDRVVFGAALGNLDSAGGLGPSGSDHSDSLAAVDSAADVLSPTVVSLAKRAARDADPHIQPITVAEDEEWYIMFVNKWAFRDFKTSTDYENAARDAAARGKNNPLFRDGDLMWDGVILREIPEIGVITGVGAAGIDVAPNFLCGAQAVGIAWAMTTQAVMDTDDYGNLKGVGIREIRGVQKLFFNSVQHGMLTLYTSGVADT